MTGLYPDAPRAADVPFTDAARQLLAGARAEAVRLQHEYVGTEHVVLAMAQDADALALLTRLGVDGDQVRASLGAVVTPGHATLPPDTERPFTSRTRQAFGLAADSAGADGKAAVGIEHILVGLLRERMNIGAQVLEHYGLSLDRATAEVRQRRDGGSAGRH